MTIEEAIAHAKEQTEIFSGTHGKFLDVAIAALEKQIPKKPTYEGDGYWNGQLVYDIWRCKARGEESGMMPLYVFQMPKEEEVEE